MKRIISLLFLSLSLQGCIFAAGAAVGAGAIVASHDSRSSKQIFNDEQSQYRLDEILATDVRFKQHHLFGTYYHNNILLVGEVPDSTTQKSLTEAVKKSFSQANHIYNETTVTTAQKNNIDVPDVWIATKVRAQLISTKGLKSSDIKVTVENRVVYLMGTVSRSQAELATQIARKVNGVTHVVKVFEYLP